MACVVELTRFRAEGVRFVALRSGGPGLRMSSLTLGPERHDLGFWVFAFKLQSRRSCGSWRMSGDHRIRRFLKDRAPILRSHSGPGARPVGLRLSDLELQSC